MNTHTLFLALVAAAWSQAAGNQPPVTLRIEADRPQWEVHERTGHVLRITNVSANAITLPSFRFLNVKQEDAEVAFFLKEQILDMQLRRGDTPVPINSAWQTLPEKRQRFATVVLKPGESLAVPFSLTRSWYPAFFSLSEPGQYTLTVTLDTTRAENAEVLKGRFVSPPAAFRIVPVATFRSQAADESEEDYARERVQFYLRRIADHRGEYFPNVGRLLHGPGAVPALIDLLDSPDKQAAARATALLGALHHPAGQSPDPIALPTTRDEWLDWWNRDGARLSREQLWSNFDSHHQ